MKKIIILLLAITILPLAGYAAPVGSNPEKARIHFEQGLKFYKEKNLNKASEEWIQALMLDENNVDVKEYFNKIYDQHFQSTTAFMEGRQLLSQGKIKDAESKFQEALNLNAGNDRFNFFAWVCEEPNVKVTIPDNHFSRNNPNAVFKVEVEKSPYAEKRIDRWTLVLMSTNKKDIVQTIKGEGTLPDTVRWDTTDPNNKPLESSGKLLSTFRLDLIVGKQLEMKTNVIFYDNAAPDVSVSANSNFSPDSPDAKLQKVDFTVKAEDKAGPLKEVDLLIYKPDKTNVGKIIKNTSGDKIAKFTWDGLYDDGSKVSGGSSVVYKVTAYDLAMNRTETVPAKLDAAIYLKKEDRGLVMNLPNIEFDFAKDTLRPNSFSILQKVAKILGQYQEAKFTIEGHTDNIGTPERNLELSKKRAEAVVKYLIDKYKINREQIIVTGYGQEKPIAPNDDDKGRAKNRRVEIIITTK